MKRLLWPVHKLLKLGDALVGSLAARLGFRAVSITIERIGEIGHALEVFVKMGELGWRPRYRAFLVAPPYRISNRAYLDYWRPYIRIVSSPFWSSVLEHAVFSPHLHFLPPGPFRGEAHWDRENASVAIGAEWERQGRPPLLQLTSEHEEGGRAALRSLGMGDDDWFVTLHVREPGYLEESTTSHRLHRNANIDTYLEAVHAIVERGGWVVRIGDPSMRPLPKLDHVIDYAHLDDLRSDWMDVYLSAACRFILATTSGMFMVSQTFGVPCAGTNWVPFSVILHSDTHVYMPKLYRSIAEDRVLTFAEMLAPELFHQHNGRRFAELGIDVVDNTSSEIRGLVLEVLDRLDGVVRYSDEDERLQARYWQLFKHYEGDIRCRVGRDWLRAHANLLPPE